MIGWQYMSFMEDSHLIFLIIPFLIMFNKDVYRFTDFFVVVI